MTATSFNSAQTQISQDCHIHTHTTGIGGVIPTSILRVRVHKKKTLVPMPGTNVVSRSSQSANHEPTMPLRCLEMVQNWNSWRAPKLGRRGDLGDLECDAVRWYLFIAYLCQGSEVRIR